MRIMKILRTELNFGSKIMVILILMLKWEIRRVTRNFLGQKSFVAIGYFDKQSCTTREINFTTQEKISWFFTGNS